MSTPYVGCFSPIYDGGMFLRALSIALVSYLDARSAKGKWLLRFSHLDVIVLKKQIELWLSVLEAYGFDWDNDFFDQASVHSKHEVMINKLLSSGLAYACNCVEDLPKTNVIYAGRCRDALKSTQNAMIRLRTPNLVYRIIDRLQGLISQNIGQQIGDFVIKNRQGEVDDDLAMVLDSVQLGINHVIRPACQLSVLSKQLYLQELLGYPSPAYLHVPVSSITQSNDESLFSLLSRTDSQKVMLLISLLESLGQITDAGLQELTPKELLRFAIEHWRVDLIPKRSY